MLPLLLKKHQIGTRRFDALLRRSIWACHLMLWLTEQTHYVWIVKRSNYLVHMTQVWWHTCGAIWIQINIDHEHLVFVTCIWTNEKSLAGLIGERVANMRFSFHLLTLQNVTCIKYWPRALNVMKTMNIDKFLVLSSNNINDINVQIMFPVVGIWAESF